jgi:hypothetical protein
MGAAQTMNWTDARSRIEGMIAALQTIEAQLTNGDIPTGGLDDLKGAVDDVRLRVWAIMAANREVAADPPALERFRLRRAADVCASLAAELEDGRVQAHAREITMLREALNRLARAVARRSQG